MRVDNLTNPVAWLWFVLFWCERKWQSLSLVSKNDAVSVSVLVQSWRLQHPSTTLTYFFRALERREALSPFYRQGVEEQRDCRIYLRSPKKAMTKLGTSQIPAHCLSSQDQISFPAVAFPRLLREHEWRIVKTHSVVVWGRKMRRGLFECIHYWHEFRKPILSGLFTVWISSSC